MGFGTFDDVAGHLRNFAHERIALEFTVLHLLQFEFPLAGHFGRSKFGNFQPAQQCDQCKCFGCRLQFTAEAHQVFFGNQLFDGYCARGRRAEAAFFHGVAQFFVFHQLAGALHRGQQRGFVETRGRLGLRGEDIDFLGLRLLAFFHRHQVRRFVVARSGLAMYFQPAGVDQHLAFALERFFFDARDARGDHVFRARIKHGQELAHHQVVELLLDFIQRLGRLRGRDDGKVVGNFRVVENAFAGFDPALLENFFRERAVLRSAQHGERFFHGVEIIFRQRARVGTRISEYFVFFVQRLRERQRGARGETEPSVGRALQTGEVEQQGRRLRRRFAFFLDFAGLVVAFGLDGPCAFFVPDTLGAKIWITFPFLFCLGEFLVYPAAGVITGSNAERAVYFPVILGHEAFDFLFALDQDRQRWRLHAAHRRFVKTAALGVERGHCARAVDADQPIGFRAADRGVGQRQHFFVAAQMFEAFLDRAGGHGLQPQALHRLLAAGVTGDVTENQLALATRVAGIDDAGDIFAFKQFGQKPQPCFRFLDRQQIKMRRDHRQVGE